MSHNYPHSYPPRTDCVWQITVEPRHQVVLTFSDFDLENSTNCRFDYLAVSTSLCCFSSQINFYFNYYFTFAGLLILLHKKFKF